MQFIVKILAVSALTSAAISAPTYAYNLGDHRRIAEQAIAEFDLCFPGLITPLAATVLWTSDLEEDLNVVRKDLFYSHYFNPYKRLAMRRDDSSMRIDGLEQALNQDADEGDRNHVDVFAHLGHVVHHLQDMTSPPHVVPVNHWLTDGFETYSLPGDISSGVSCSDLVRQPVNSLHELLVATAKQTLDNVDHIQVSITRAAAAALLFGGDAFWKASADASFGVYGFLGNHFGQPSFTQDGVAYTVPVDFYARFKQTQMKQGTKATLQALYWFLFIAR